MIPMPAMAHVSEPDLSEIYTYIQNATKGIKQANVKAGDPYPDGATMTARPRIICTFMPDTGPASLYIALPTDVKHNIVWDTTHCRLRYITTGEPNAYRYYKGSGTGLATTGDTIYTEESLA